MAPCQKMQGNLLVPSFNKEQEAHGAEVQKLFLLHRPRHARFSRSLPGLCGMVEDVERLNLTTRLLCEFEACFYSDETYYMHLFLRNRLIGCRIDCLGLPLLSNVIVAIHVTDGDVYL